jgi:manganese/zinc/iron transport system permease protein
MDKFLEFFSFTDANIRFVTAGTVLLAISSSLVGCFTFLRKRTLTGDVVSHSILPGICVAFLLFDSKNPLILLAGAFSTGWLSIVGVDYIVKNSKIKEDAALALVLSVFFGLGIFLLTAIQHTDMANQTGLDKFLFGKAASLVGEDVRVFGFFGLSLVLLLYLFFKEITLITFDKNFAQTSGMPIRFLETLLSTLTVLAVVVGIQAVGVILMAAMLITPASAARYWTNNLKIMLFLAAVFSTFSGVAGAFISFTAPGMATGPWMVLVLSGIAFASFIFAPQKGIVHRWLLQKRNRKQISEENLLKALYKSAENEKDFEKGYRAEDLQDLKVLKENQLASTTQNLVKDRFLVLKNGAYHFTKEGLEKGKRVTRAHRLWEMYLTKFLHLPPDHVHDDSESIEHVITPELEDRIAQALGNPEKDPHEREIPY